MLAAFLPKSVQAVLNVPVSQLSDAQLSDIMSDLGFGSWHPDLRTAAVKLLQDQGIDTAAEAIQHPEALKQLNGLVKSFKSTISATQGSCDFCGGPLVKEGSSLFCQQCGIHH